MSFLNKAAVYMTIPIIVYGFFVMLVYLILLLGSICVIIGGTKTGYLNFNKELVEEYNQILTHRVENR